MEVPGLWVGHPRVVVEGQDAPRLNGQIGRERRGGKVEQRHVQTRILTGTCQGSHPRSAIRPPHLLPARANSRGPGSSAAAAAFELLPRREEVQYLRHRQVRGAAEVNQNGGRSRSIRRNQTADRVSSERQRRTCGWRRSIPTKPVARQRSRRTSIGTTARTRTSICSCAGPTSWSRSCLRMGPKNTFHPDT